MAETITMKLFYSTHDQSLIHSIMHPNQGLPNTSNSHIQNKILLRLFYDEINTKNAHKYQIYNTSQSSPMK